MKPSGKYFNNEAHIIIDILKQIFLTERKNTSVNHIGEQEDDGGPDGGLAAQVRVDDGEAPDQTDGPVYDHAQAAKKHRSKPVPVAACYIKSNQITTFQY